jgi:uracil permease
MPEDVPPVGAMLSLGFQQVLTMFPATVLVAILTKFDVGVTLFTSGLGTIIALLVANRQIPLYYGSSFSYITVIITVMSKYASNCFADPATVYCPDGVRIAQVGILCTGLFNILFGLLIQRIGKAHLDKVLPPIITGSVAIIIGIALAGTALSEASTNWAVAFITLVLTVAFSVYLQGKGLIGMLPILLGAIAGYIASLIIGWITSTTIVDFTPFTSAQWLRVPAFTLPAFGSGEAWGMAISVALIAIATIPESTAHLYQMSLYVDELAKELGRPPLEIKQLIGRNLVADGCSDAINGMLGGCAGTNYGENNSLMAITRNYSVAVLMTAGAMAMVLGFIGKLAGLINTIPVAVIGGLSIYLFGVIGKQGVALIQSEKVNLFDPKNLAIGAIILVLGIGGNLGLPNGLFPFKIPFVFPDGIPAIVFAAIVGILFNALFLVLPPSLFGVKERSNIND